MLSAIVVVTAFLLLGLLLRRRGRGRGLGALGPLRLAGVHVHLGLHGDDGVDGVTAAVTAS